MLSSSYVPTKELIDDLVTKQWKKVKSSTLGRSWGTAQKHAEKRRNSVGDGVFDEGVEETIKIKKSLWRRSWSVWNTSDLPRSWSPPYNDTSHKRESRYSVAGIGNEFSDRRRSLADQTAVLHNHSLPAHLNSIDELDGDDADPPPQRPSPRYVKSTSVRKKLGRAISPLSDSPPPLFIQAQRSQSLTNLGCPEEAEGSLDDAMEPPRPADASTRMPGPRHYLTVSMSDLTRVEQQRSRLQKPPTKASSSQEYFTVSFDVNDEHIQEYLPAVQGRQLRDALRDILEDRGIDVGMVQIYQEPGNTPFLPYCDTGRLSGCHLQLKIKDPPYGFSANGQKAKVNGHKEKPELSKKLSTGSSRRKPPFFGSSSTEDINEPLYPSNSHQQNWKPLTKTKSTGFGIFTNPFKSDNDKLVALSESLDRYNQHGLPDLPGLITFDASDDKTMYHLESEWTDVVHRHDEMSDRMQQQQNAIWELLQTEVNYINQLKVITNRFKLCLCNLQSEGILNEIAVDSVFSNIHDVYVVNRTFWQEHLLPMLATARATHEPLKPMLMKEGFLKFDMLFSPYTKYCMDRANCLQYIKDKKHGNELFKAYVAWCETQKECNRQRFTDLTVKPMQRLTKYSLLLKVILKNTEDEATKHILISMSNAVDSFVKNVNLTLNQRHEQERLAAISSRIESYEAVEIKDEEVQKVLRQYLELDLTCPMPGCNSSLNRQLLLEGDLKFRDSMKNSMDVRCFLFTDMLLVCKPVNKKGDKVKVVRQPCLVDRLVVQELKERSSLLMIYLNEYKVATAAYMLSGNDIKQWAEHIRKAQEIYNDAKSSIPQQEIGFFTNDDDEELDFPTHALLTVRSPRSSQSSLVHSHSGSIDMNDPTSCASHGRAVSLELTEMRASSASSDEGASDARGRTQSLDLRQQQQLSPRPERRLHFFKSNSGSSSPNTLSVSYPYGNDALPPETSNNESSAVSLQVPSPKMLSPTSRSVTHPPVSPRLLKRGLPVVQSSKPPLVKTKNISPVGSHSSVCDNSQAEYSLQPTSQVINTVSPDSDEDSSKSKLNQKRAYRTDRRYHTADSIENLKRDKDPSIHKRFSLNYPTGGAQNSSGNISSGKNIKHSNQITGKCNSSDSMYSSSGVSSTGSLHQPNDGSGPFAELSENDINETSPIFTHDFLCSEANDTELFQNPKKSSCADMHLDISEIKDGISSVQIRIQDSSTQDIRRMKEFILNDQLLEASEV